MAPHYRHAHARRVRGRLIEVQSHWVGIPSVHVPTDGADEESAGSYMQLHYKVKDLAKAWGLSYNTVLREVKEEPDVLRIGEPSPRRRTKITLRVPADVADRIWRRLSGRSLDDSQPHQADSGNVRPRVRSSAR